MSRFIGSKRGVVFAALVGTSLLAASPVRAQSNAAQRVGAVTQVPAGADAKEEKTLRAVDAHDLRRIAAGALDVGTNKLIANGDDIWVDVTNSNLDNLLVARLVDPTDGLLGATLQPVGDVLRAQLDIPAGQGLLVASLRGDGPSAQAGVLQNDILLSLADKPLASADDLTKQLKAAGEAPASLKLLRAGKPVALQVRPVYRVTLGPVEQKKTEYFIGVSIDSADDALRSQLGLPAGRGVVVTDVVAGSPAEKAGVKKYDIVVELAGKPIDSPETLSAQVQANQEKGVKLILLRGGKSMTIPIAGAVRKVEASPPSAEAFGRYLTLRDQNGYTALVNSNVLSDRLAWSAAGGDDLRPRLDHLEKELKALRAAVEKLNETLKAGKATKGD